jgi:pimeloyl-ACP methyl ester carboxylesterase
VHRITIAIVTLGAVVLAACSSTASDVTAVEANILTASDDHQVELDVEIDSGTLEWEPCTDVGSALVDIECATLMVPLDHEQPEGTLIEIALARVPTTVPGDRIGSLVFNPGGPGGSGIDFLANAAVLVPDEVAGRFDLVSFDPRGVGTSAAVDCDDDLDDQVPLLASDDDEGWADLVADAAGFTETCTDESLDLAVHVGTNNAARDLDLIRDALGDDELSYVGFSYGTRLGATYAELFPDNVRALVLDGGVKPTDDLAELDGEQGEGFDAALESFADACDSDDDCVLRDSGPALKVYTGLVEEIADAGSFMTDEADRVLTPGELQLGVAAALYSKQTWPILADALFLADTESDGTLLQALVDSYAGRAPDGTYSNSQVANGFINCADDPRRPPVDEVRAEVDVAASKSVYFDEFLRASTSCIGVSGAVDPLVIGPAEGAPSILVLGNTGDPATPYEWSVELADSLASGVLYTVEAEGHTAYLSIPCAESVVNSYLIDLEVPAVGASCSDNDGADFFPPSGESEIDALVALFDCLRENGADIPEFSVADLIADPSGELLLEALDPSDPDFLEALLACEDLLGEL